MNLGGWGFIELVLSRKMKKSGILRKWAEEFRVMRIFYTELRWLRNVNGPAVNLYKLILI